MPLNYKKLIIKDVKYGRSTKPKSYGKYGFEYVPEEEEYPRDPQLGFVKEETEEDDYD